MSSPNTRFRQETSRYLLVRKNNDTDMPVRVDGTFTYNAGRNEFKRRVKAGFFYWPKKL